MKTITFIAIALCYCIVPASSQPSQEWVARYNSGNADQLYDMTVDKTGNVYVTGASVQTGLLSDYLTIKYNSSGGELWRRGYDGVAGSDDRAYAIFVDKLGNVYVTGGTAYNNSIVTIKYNSVGDTIWTRAYTGPMSGNNWTFAKSIFVDDSGYVYIAGTSEGMSAVHGLRQDYTTIKYSPIGLPVWVARYNGPGTDADIINSMTVDLSGNVYVTGFAGGGSTGSADPYNDITTIKYNPFGDTLWKRTYQGPGTSSDLGNKITLDRFGNVYITGSTYLSAIIGDDIVTIKYSSGGTKLWTKFFNGNNSATDIGNDLVADSSGNVFVTGKSNYSALNGFDIITIKYDSTGTESWAKNFNGTSNGHDKGERIRVDAVGNIYVLGLSVNTLTAEDYQLIKYNTSGIQQWQIKYTNSNAVGSQDNPAAIFVDGMNNIYAAGQSALDYAVVKYSQTSKLKEISDQYELTVFPNPTSGKIIIEYQNQEQDRNLEVFNILGKKVYQSIITPTLNQTKSEIDLTSQPDGIYYLTYPNSQFKKGTKICIQH